MQDNGYTYDYFSPDFLTADGVYYHAETGTLEQAGYQAIVLWQEQLALDGAKALLDLAKQGMKVVVVDGAAVQTPYNDGGEAALADVMAEMKALPNVYSAKDADDVARVLQSAGVKPYAGFAEPNRQLLTQTRRDGDTEYLYVYNYCDGSYVSVWSQGESRIRTAIPSRRRWWWTALGFRISWMRGRAKRSVWGSIAMKTAARFSR